MLVHWPAPHELSPVSERIAPMPLTTARLGPEDWQTLRDIRLAGLAESPDAFRATWAGESGSICSMRRRR